MYIDEDSGSVRKGVSVTLSFFYCYINTSENDVCIYYRMYIEKLKKGIYSAEENLRAKLWDFYGTLHDTKL